MKRRAAEEWNERESINTCTHKREPEKKIMYEMLFGRKGEKFIMTMMR